jgi:hypothetical protein
MDEQPFTPGSKSGAGAENAEVAEKTFFILLKTKEIISFLLRVLCVLCGKSSPSWATCPNPLNPKLSFGQNFSNLPKSMTAGVLPRLISLIKLRDLLKMLLLLVKDSHYSV